MVLWLTIGDTAGEAEVVFLLVRRRGDDNNWETAGMVSPSLSCVVVCGVFHTIVET